MGGLQRNIDAAYKAAFQDVQLPDEADASKQHLTEFSEAAFGQLGRDNPKVSRLLAAAFISSIFGQEKSHVIPLLQESEFSFGG